MSFNQDFSMIYKNAAGGSDDEEDRKHLEELERFNPPKAMMQGGEDQMNRKKLNQSKGAAVLERSKERVNDDDPME